MQDKNRLRAVIARGGCMRPLIKPGAAVLIKPKPRYRTGDIICYRSSGRSYIHRIVKKKGDIIKVSDDAGITGMQRVKPDDIRGVLTPCFLSGLPGLFYRSCAVNIYRVLRRLKNFLKTVK